MKSDKVRIELRFDAVDDEDMIDFIDKNGSTRAGFIKQILKMYKNQTEPMIPNAADDLHNQDNEVYKESSTSKKKKKPSNLGGISYSSKDFE